MAVDVADQARLIASLKEYGAPVSLVKPGEFLQEDFVFHFGLSPWRVDILTSIPGVDFEAAYVARTTMKFGPLDVNVISIDWLIKAKRASGRPLDLVDLANLEAVAKKITDKSSP